MIEILVNVESQESTNDTPSGPLGRPPHHHFLRQNRVHILLLYVSILYHLVSAANLADIAYSRTIRAN